MKVGILALQGDVDAHRRMLDRVGVAALVVRTPEHLDAVDRLILPGGESTTMSRLLDTSGLAGPLAARLQGGMPVFGTCAGLILLSTEVVDGRPDQLSFGAIDVRVRRNGYGRQLDSFEADLAVTGLAEPLHALFIRAPRIERVGPGVEVLARLDGDPVLCRSGPVLAGCFHPELASDPRLHAAFCAMEPA